MPDYKLTVTPRGNLSFIAGSRRSQPVTEHPNFDDNVSSSSAFGHLIFKKLVFVIGKVDLFIEPIFFVMAKLWFIIILCQNDQELKCNNANSREVNHVSLMKHIDKILHNSHILSVLTDRRFN